MIRTFAMFSSLKASGALKSYGLYSWSGGSFPCVFFVLFFPKKFMVTLYRCTLRRLLADWRTLLLRKVSLKQLSH